MIAHVHAEEMSRGDAMEFAFGVFALFVEAGGVVVVDVYGIEIPVIELLALGIGIGDRAGKRPKKTVEELIINVLCVSHKFFWPHRLLRKP